MDDVATRIRRITADLNALQSDLEWAKVHSASEDTKAALLEEILKADLVPDFKSSVDRMRHFLWAYIEAAANNAGRQDVDYELQSYRLRRVTEMLQKLRANGPMPDISGMPEGRTFFEHVTAMVDTYRAGQAEEAAEPRSKGKAA